MANSTPQWKPLEVLKIDNIFTCSGWAPSKGRKCGNRIAAENRELATEIMEDMSLLDVRSTDFKASLKSLAKPLLCRAYHVKDPDQHTALRRQWGKHIEAYKVTVNARQPQAATAHGSASVTVESLQEELETLRATMALLIQRTAESTRVEHTPSVASSTLSPQTTQIHQAASPDNESRRTQTEADRSQHLRSVSEPRTQNVTINISNSPPRDSASVEEHRPHQTHSTIPPPSENTEASSSHPSSHPTPNPTAREHHHENVPSEPSHPTTTNTQPATPEEEQSHQTADHSRRPIEGDCSICCEDLQSGENISWCKAQCGQNFHADCVGVWLATLGEGHQTCPYCRVSWVN